MDRQTKHTAPQWETDEQRNGFNISIYDKNGETVAIMSPDSLTAFKLGNLEKVKYRARLIASAPELFEALKRTLWKLEMLRVERGIKPDEAEELGKQAIAKAEGC